MITKQMSSKIRVNYFATTDIMRYCKNLLPLSLLQGLCGNFLGSSNLREKFLLPLMKENFEFVLK